MSCIHTFEKKRKLFFGVTKEVDRKLLYWIELTKIITLDCSKIPLNNSDGLLIFRLVLFLLFFFLDVIKKDPILTPDVLTVGLASCLFLAANTTTLQ